MTDEEMNDNESSLDFEEEESADEEESLQKKERREILTKGTDSQIDSLYGKWERGKLILQPSFQRKYVWDRKKASRLIESVLLSVPLPIIYLAEEQDGKEYIIDGQQRLTSFFSFIKGEFPNGQPFKLTGMSVYPELNRKSYRELPEEYQDKLFYYALRVITILKDSDSDIKFEIFERLNTGSVALNPMELRNCIYRGKYMALLKELAADSEFQKLLGLSIPDKRMKDVELVLRFAAFYHATHLRYNPPMKSFFNDDMAKYRDISDDDANKLRVDFKKAVQVVLSLFPDTAFKRFTMGHRDNPNGHWEPKRFNASLYDVQMGIFYGYEKNRIYGALDSIREGLIDLMVSDDTFNDAILIGTSEREKVKTRFNIALNRIDEIMKENKTQARCFSLDLKQQLFDADPTCAICGQRIQHLDDSAVDHIEQYWKGGQTIPENARLTHKYCNNSRPRND